jgi:hypothetical protein
VSIIGRFWVSTEDILQSSCYRLAAYARHMRLSEQAIEEFKEICKDEFGVELSDAEAEQHALRVLNLFWLVLTDDDPQPASTNIDASKPQDVP